MYCELWKATTKPTNEYYLLNASMIELIQTLQQKMHINTWNQRSFLHKPYYCLHLNMLLTQLETETMTLWSCRHHANLRCTPVGENITHIFI